MDTRDLIREFILSDLVADGNGKTILDDDSLITSGIIDSMGIISLLGFVEEKFSIEISSDELLPENFETLSTITDLVTRKMSA
jgi:acyl carrier protein